MRFFTYTYDTVGYNTYRTSQGNALGHVTRWAYDYRKGVPIQETDPNGIITAAEYDGFGRLTKLIRPGQSSAAPSITVGYFDYGVNNQGPFLVDIQERHSGGVYNVRRFYNGLGQLLQEQVANAQVNGGAYDVAVDNAYNAYGQRVQETRPYLLAVWTSSAGGTPYRGQNFTNPKTVTSYDGFGRVTRVQSPTSAEYTAYSYPDDLQVRRCDGLNHCTLTLSDVWGRVAEVRSPAEPWLRYAYDAADQLLAVEQRTGGGGALFATTTMSYDLAGRKIAMSDPDLGNWSYTYDGADNLRTQTDARNCRTTLSYDLLDRVTQKSYAAVSGGSCGVTTAAVSYGYDAFAAGTNYGRGKRTSMTDGSGSATWRYGDVRGRLTQETKTITGGGSFVTEWTYDAADLPTWMRYPDGEQVTTSYLRQKLVNGVSGSSVYAQATQYDAAGRVELRTLGSNQVRTDPGYFGWTVQGGRMQWLRSGAGTNEDLQKLEYAYDAVGNVSWVKDYLAGGVQTQSFSYDAMDRLLSAGATGGSGGTYSESYSYDSAGRLVNGPRERLHLRERCAQTRRDRGKRRPQLRLRRQRQPDQPHHRRAERHPYLRRREPAGERERGGERQLRLRRRRQAGQGDGERRDELLRGRLLRSGWRGGEEVLQRRRAAHRHAQRGDALLAAERPSRRHGAHPQRGDGDGRGALQSLRRNPLHIGDDADDLPLHRTAGRGKPRSLLLQRPLVRPGAGALPRAGQHRAGRGQCAGLPSLCVCALQSAQVHRPVRPPSGLHDGSGRRTRLFTQHDRGRPDADDQLADSRFLPAVRRACCGAAICHERPHAHPGAKDGSSAALAADNRAFAARRRQPERLLLERGDGPGR
jgi:YD repeat-containing protein